MAYGLDDLRTTVTTTASGTRVEAYDVGNDERWINQHCPRHHDDPTTTDFCPPQRRPRPDRLGATG